MEGERGRPSDLDHLRRGAGIPPVALHCSRALPPAITVCGPLGCSSTEGGSLPAEYQGILIFITHMIRKQCHIFKIQYFLIRKGINIKKEITIKNNNFLSTRMI